MSHLPRRGASPLLGEEGIRMTGIEIATCSYGEFRPEFGYPVRTSRGAPKWFIYPYMSWDNVFPSYSMLQMEYDRYRPRYLELLNNHGPVKLRGDLEYISEEYAKANDGEVRPLVLLCYEKLSKGPDQWCHRTLLADWLQQKLNLNVTELGAQLAPPIDPEPTLF